METKQRAPEERLDSKFMAQVMTQQGFMRWAEGKSITILDVKPEWRDALSGNFIERRA